MGLLQGRPLSLYDVHKHLDAGMCLLYAASFGSIQRALEQLATKGWATKVDALGSSRGKKLYVISDTGRAAWREWMFTPITEANSESAIVTKAYLLGFLPPADRAACLAQLRSRVDADTERLTTMNIKLDSQEVPPQFLDIFRFQRATLDLTIRELALTRQWIDELEQL